MQKKDIIYIDVEDDITAIIGKIKDAKEKIVALVPPKRIGVLQSAVNLRLLARSADTGGKRLVIITSNEALAGLAANAKIPVAKNLQSRPELAEIPVLKIDDDDTIDGEQIPTKAAAASIPVKDSSLPKSKVEDIDIEGPVAVAAAGRAAKSRSAGAKGAKVPDFGVFRKRLVIIIAASVLLLSFLIWAIWFAPRAQVVISAKTIDQVLNIPVSLGSELTTDSEKDTIRSVVKEQKETQTVDFNATGEKNVGERATGTVGFSKSSPGSVYIAAGTNLTSEGGKVYTTSAAVTVPGASLGWECPGNICSGSASITVTATEIGADYNGASGSVSGIPSGVSASFSAATAGGSDKMVKIVTQGDVEKAKAQLAEQKAEDIKAKLEKTFESGDVVIDNSFGAIGGGDAQSAPAIGQEAASGKAKLTREVTYTMTAIKKTDLDTYLDAAFKTTLTNKDEQRVYDNGRDKVAFEGFKTNEKQATAVLKATAQIGPRIDDGKIKELAKGKRTGELIGEIKAIEGVSDVQVNLSPFWVSGVPSDDKKITIEFKLIKDD